MYRLKVLPGKARAELGRGKFLPLGREAGLELGEEDAVAGFEGLLALPEPGQGCLQAVVLGHGFLDHRVQLGRLEELPPVLGYLGP